MFKLMLKYNTNKFNNKWIIFLIIKIIIFKYLKFFENLLNILIIY